MVTDGPKDGPTDEPTDRPTDTTSYRDARTHLKIINYLKLQTHPSNIVIMETPPSTKYPMYNFTDINHLKYI